MKKLNLLLLIATTGSTFLTHGMTRQEVMRELEFMRRKPEAEPAVWQRGYPGPQRLVRPRRRPARPVAPEREQRLQKFREEKKRKENLLALNRQKLRTEKRRLIDGMRFLVEEGRREIQNRIDRLRDTIKRLGKEIRTMRPPRPLQPSPRERRRLRYVGRPFVGIPIEEEALRLIERRPETLERLEREQVRRKKLKARIRKKIITRIEGKIYSQDKDISEEEWIEARRASNKIPNFRPNIRQLLQKELGTVLEAAKTIDTIYRKLYSEEKDIQEEEWENAKSMARKIPTYEPYYKSDIIDIFSSKLSLNRIKEYAKAIDRIEKEVEATPIKIKSGKCRNLIRRALSTLEKLPEYKRNFIIFVQNIWNEIEEKLLEKQQQQQLQTLKPLPIMWRKPLSQRKRLTFKKEEEEEGEV